MALTGGGTLPNEITGEWTEIRDRIDDNNSSNTTSPSQQATEDGGGCAGEVRQGGVVKPCAKGMG